MNNPGLAVLLTGLAVVLLFAGVANLRAPSRERREMVSTVLRDGSFDGSSRLRQWNKRFVKTRLGKFIDGELVLAGLEEQLAIVVGGLALGGGVLVAWVLATTLSPVLSVFGVVAMVMGLRAFLKSAKQRRNEKFVGQMPELARVLSNATNAGLSIHAAVVVAGGELAEPAGPEMQQVAQRLAFGDSLEKALTALQERLPSREVAVLVSTLLVSARSGGSLVTALRDIAETLDQRKETRREVKTTLAQATTTAYMVIGIGIASLFLLNTIKPGTVDLMVSSWLGRAALIFSSVVFAGGFVAIRKMTRYDG